MVIFTTFKCESNSIPTQMIRIINYVPKYIGPTKLDQVLAYCPELSNVNKEKVCVIADIAKLGKLLEMTPICTKTFDEMYEKDIPVLEGVQQALQAQWNTVQYHRRYASNTGL